MLTTIDKTEVEKFSKMARDWWNPNGKFKPLHLFNPARIMFIKEKLISHFGRDPNKEKPLEKLKILDIGCGGGLLCEPLSRLGASMTGIDASENNIKVAELHSKEMDLKIKYIRCSPENLDLKNEFDVILNMEVVEHVNDLNFFIKSCSSLLKKNGIMFIATINKTLKSYIFAIIGAEYVLNWLPVGTHDWFKFVEPEKLENLCKNNNLSLSDIRGLSYNVLIDKWVVNKNTQVNYISKFKKY